VVINLDLNKPSYCNNNNNNVTIVCTCADSYVEASVCEAGAAAELAAAREMAKYSDLSDQYSFYPVAVETLGAFNETAYELVGNLDRCIVRLSGDDRESSFLFQRSSVLVQRFNSILLHDSFWLLIIRISGLSGLVPFVIFEFWDLCPG